MYEDNMTTREPGGELNDFLRSETMKEELIDYSYFDRRSAGHERRCIDGRMTGCGNCVGYCLCEAHSGFLTREHRQEHDCIGKGCFYYLEKPKQAKQKSAPDRRPQEILSLAAEMTAGLEGMKIMRAEKAKNNAWDLCYITISNAYPIRELESRLSKRLGETISLIRLNYDFERAAQLIFAAQR